MFGVVDDTTTMKFVNRACAVHGISLPVVVVVLKFPSVQLTTTAELAFYFGSHLELINKNETRTIRCGGSFFITIKEHTVGFYWIAEVFHIPDFLF